MQWCCPYQKAFATNQNASAFTNKLARVTEPKDDGVITICPGGNGQVYSHMKILPYGLGANDDAFSMKVWGWSRVGGSNTPTGTLWVPTPLAVFTCIISSTAIGIAGSPVLNTEMFADTIAFLTDNIVSQPTDKGADNAGVISMGGIKIFSGAGNQQAWILMPTFAHEKIEFDFDQTTNTPPCNALVKFLNCGD